MLPPVEALQHLGGSATSADLVSVCGRPGVRSALERGDVVRLARGRYALPGAPDPFVSAHRLGGVMSHTSAAQYWGMAVAMKPLHPHVTVRRHRSRARPTGVQLHWADLADADRTGQVTSPLRTVLDCARVLPRGEALAVADSAVRAGHVGADELRAAARGLRGAGRTRVLGVADDADARSGSALESLTRAIVLDAGLTGFQPQLVISDDGFRARVDLGDRVLRIVLEADSFEHHGHRSALVRDCERYDELVVRGWLVLRFAWEQVVGRPDWVADMVKAAVMTRRTGWQK